MDTSSIKILVLRTAPLNIIRKLLLIFVNLARFHVRRVQVSLTVLLVINLFHYNIKVFVWQIVLLRLRSLIITHVVLVRVTAWNVIRFRNVQNACLNIYWWMVDASINVQFTLNQMILGLIANKKLRQR